jgi:hypothetical protein
MIDNLTTLHAEEERLRTQSLAYIAANEEMRDHLYVIQEAMNLIFGLTRDHVHRSDDDDSSISWHPALQRCHFVY